MKSRLLFALLLLVSAAVLGAQTIHEPNSEIYKDIDRWFVQGYIKDFLPMVRPYPIGLIDKILNDVIDNGSAQAREKAAAYRDALAPGSRPVHFGVTGYLQGKNEDKGVFGSVFAEGSGRITDMLSFSGHFALYGMTDEGGERFTVPGYYTPYTDVISDISSVGKIEIRQNWTSLMAFGNSDTYFQAGLSRSSFGPFYDNGIVVGPQAPRAGHFSFVFWRPGWSFEMLFQPITATNDFGDPKPLFGNKYNIIHSISFRPLDTLELGFVQSLVWGDKLNLLYLAPFTFLFASQSLANFSENSFMGPFIRWRPFDTFLVNGQVYIDDFSFNGLLAGDPRIKAAYEIGLSWAPTSGLLSKLDFDYTAVFPYMYTHWAVPDDNLHNPEGPNYYNYTHLGKNIGPNLDPNSDRISVRTNWNAHPGIDINASAYLIRHAAVSDGINPGDPEWDNGSIFDHGSLKAIPGSSRKNIRNYGWYLTQGLIGVRLGGTLGVSWSLPTSFGVFKVSGAYGAQYNWNRWGPYEAPQSGVNGLDHFWSFGGMWSW